MRKLYNHSKGKIHPSPSSSATSDHPQFLLPFTIATLAAALSSEDQEVLSYLLSVSATTTNFSAGSKPNKNSAGAGSSGDHPPQFSCDCFRCYTSFWVRWDSSPNRKLIHEIIDAYEDGLIHKKKNGKNKKERKNKVLASSSTATGPHAPPSPAESVSHAPSQIESRNSDCEGEMDLGSAEKGSVRKIINFIGDRIWGVWGV